MTSTATLPTTAGRSIVEINSLSKSFKDVTAVDDLSFSVEPGQVCGLLGPNGAGKTTTLRMLVGLIGPTSGSARLFGELVRPGAPELARVGALVEQAAFAPNLSGMANLRLWWQAGGGRMADADLDGALAVAGLGDAVHRKVKGYSQGMKQRLGLAQALLHRPSVLFLDEPTDGVDPVGRKQIRDLLLAERARGVTIFINSHLLGEVEQLCDRVAILKKGQLALVGTVPEVVGDKSTWLVGFDGPPPGDQRWQSARLVPSGTAGLWRLTLDSAGGIDRFLDEARGRGLLLRHLERERGTLEEIYLQLADAGGPSS